MQNYQQLMRKARATNAKRNVSDHSAGFAAPSPEEPLGLLRTAMTAISCGIKMGDWNNVAEGQAMFEEFMKAVGQEEWLQTLD